MHTPNDITGSKLSSLDKEYISQWLTWIDDKLKEFKYEQRRPESDGSFLIKLTAQIPINKHIVNAIVTLYRRYDWQVEQSVQINTTRRPTYILNFIPPDSINQDETIIIVDTTMFENMRSLADYKAGYIYLLKSENGLHKIGRSKTPNIRISQITKAIAPFDIQVIHAAYYDDRIKAETQLHQMFKNKRRRGEWFELTELEIKAIIEHSYRPL